MTDSEAVALISIGIAHTTFGLAGLASAAHGPGPLLGPHFPDSRPDRWPMLLGVLSGLRPGQHSLSVEAHRVITSAEATSAIDPTCRSGVVISAAAGVAPEPTRP